MHFREGGHNTTIEDWDVRVEFADHVFFGKPASKPLNRLPFPPFKVPDSWKRPGL